MEVISVPAPPKASFNKNRRVSDLLMGQLKHFQHVAHKRELGIDPALERDIYTEAGAARYIASITRALRGSGVGKPVLVARKPRKGVVLDMAAAGTGAVAVEGAASTAKSKKAKKGSGRKAKRSEK